MTLNKLLEFIGESVVREPRLSAVFTLEYSSIDLNHRLCIYWNDVIDSRYEPILMGCFFIGEGDKYDSISEISNHIRKLLKKYKEEDHIINLHLSRIAEEINEYSE